MRNLYIFMMRHFKLSILATLLPLLVSCTSSGRVQQTELSTTQQEHIFNLIVQLPAENMSERRYVFGELLKLGPEGIRALTDVLIPEGLGDDTYARYALNGLARHVSRPGAEVERAMFESVLLVELTGGSSRAVKTFLIKQLELAGSDESVPVLESFLKDHFLYAPATHALTAIGTPAAQEALHRGLSATDGARKVAVIKALGDLQFAPAAEDILLLTSDKNTNVSETALYALAQIGRPGATDVLEDAVASSISPHLRTQALALQLTYASRLAEEGYLARSNTLASHLFDTYDEAHIKGAALAQLVRNRADEADDKLLTAAASSDGQLRSAALSLADALPETSTAGVWLKMLKQSPPPVQADIITMLGQWKDASPASEIKSYLNHDNIEVRLAAIDAFTTLAGETALSELIDRLEKSSDSRERKALKEALLRIPGRQLSAAAAKALSGASDQTKPLLMELLAVRQSNSYLREVLNHTQHPSPEVRQAALQALESLAGPDDLPTLVDLLKKAEGEREQKQISQAIVTISKNMDNPQNGLEPVLTGLEHADGTAKTVLLHLLPRIGGDKALSTLIDATQNTNADVHRAAIEALADWPESSAIPAMLTILETSSGEHSEQLTDGLVRLIPASRYSMDNKLKWLTRIAKLAPTPREKITVLQAMASLKSPAALKVIAGYLTHPDAQISSEAVRQTANMLTPSEQSAESLTAANSVLSIIETTVNPQLRRRIEQQIQYVRTREREAGEFAPLFNGQDLSGWIGATDTYRVEDGKMISKPGTSGNIFTEDEYSDFILRFDFKLTEGANNGLGIRAPLEGDPAYEGMELQILDNSAQQYADLKPYQYHGSVYGIVPARRGYMNPVGEWNSQEVIVRGSHITVKLNGTVILDADVNEAASPEPIDGREHPGLKRHSGHIGFLGHGSQVEFSNIRIRDLTRHLPNYSANDDNDGPLNQPPEGFKALFNGRDLSGWKGLVGDPESRAQMSPEELAREQAKADSLMRAHWSVRDGILYFDGEGSHLCTIDEYEDFEMLLDWKIEPGGDSGIYLRGVPQVQIWDVTEWPQGSGGLYNNQIHPADPLKVADNPIGEWNHMRIRMIGDEVTVYLNDQLVVDDVVLENYWDRSKPVYSAGQIELQSHSTPLYFRNIFIREIPRTRELFSGHDLSGWQHIGANTGSWKTANGILYSDRDGGWLSTIDMYDNFKLEFEYRLPEGGNSSVLLRAPHGRDPAHTGLEIPLLDSGTQFSRGLFTDSMFSIQGSTDHTAKSSGQWQQIKIIADGPALQVTLNGQRILNTNLAEYMDQAQEYPGLKSRRGYIGLKNHNTRTEFRNIRITEIE